MPTHVNFVRIHRRRRRKKKRGKEEASVGWAGREPNDRGNARGEIVLLNFEEMRDIQIDLFV